MTFAQQMRIEIVNIIELLSANVTFPWITFAVTTFVQKVQRLIGKFDATK